MTYQWSLGDVFVLRHSGMPFEWLEELAFSDQLAEAAKQVLDLEDQWQQRRDDFQGDPALQKAFRLGRQPRPPKGEQPLEEMAAAWQEARKRLNDLFEQEQEERRNLLHGRSGHEMVLEAVFLSNPTFFQNVWQRYAEGEIGRANAKNRRVERKIYTYLQRFCGKNETTSFFGPIGYGEVAEGVEFEVQVNDAKPVERRTFISYWAVSELARFINKTKGLWDLLPLRINPLFTVSNGIASCNALGKNFSLNPQTLQFLDALGDQGSLAGACGKLELTSAQGRRLAFPLLKQTILLHGISLPSDDLDSFETLVAQVTALPASDDRTVWLERLKTLDGLRADFQTANLASRQELLLKIEKTFQDLTAAEPRRGEGMVYADRLVIYEEGRSPFLVRVSRAFLDKLAAGIHSGLELSASFGHLIQSQHRELMTDLLKQRGGQMDFLSYAMAMRPEGELESRFAPVPPVSLPKSSEPTVHIPKDFQGKAVEGRRYALPDIFLAGKSPEEISKGKVEIVMGRVHHHLLLWSWLGTFYPDRDRFKAVAGEWLGNHGQEEAILGLAVKRRNKGFYQFPGQQTVAGLATVGNDGQEMVPPSTLTVENHDKGVALTDGAGQKRNLYLCLDDFSHYPPFAALTHPQVLHMKARAEGDHTPRIQVGDSVYQRRQWTMHPHAIKGLSGLNLYLQVQRDRRKQGYPRYVFARVTSERKPYLIDTRCIFAMDILKHLAGRGEPLSLTEMSPGPEDLWLRDRRGRYTCEMRMQAVRRPLAERNQPTAALSSSQPSQFGEKELTP